MVTINGDTIIEKVYKQYSQHEFHLDEKGTAFLLGYHLQNQHQRDVAFEIGWTGDSAITFSPDLDVLAVGDQLVGYEVKGLQGDHEQVSKRQLYTGLGQAISLLNQPLGSDGGCLQHSYLAIAAPSNSNHEYLHSVLPAIEQTPIGVITVSRTGYEVIREPTENSEYRPDLHSQVVTHLRDQATGTDTRHPDSGLQSLALQILDHHNEKQRLL